MKEISIHDAHVEQGICKMLNLLLVDTKTFDICLDVSLHISSIDSNRKVTCNYCVLWLKESSSIIAWFYFTSLTVIILSSSVYITVWYTHGLHGGLPCTCMAYYLMGSKQQTTGPCPKLLGCNRFIYRCVYIMRVSLWLLSYFCQTPFKHWFDLLSVVSWLLMGLTTWKLFGEA